MSSRLFQNIREKRGLVYSIYSSLNLYRDAGTLIVYAGVAPKAARKVVDLTMKEIRPQDRKASAFDTTTKKKEDRVETQILRIFIGDFDNAMRTP